MLCNVGGRQFAYEPRVGVDHDTLGVEVAHRAAHAVVHVDEPIVAPADHAITDGNLDGAVGGLLAEQPESTQKLSGCGVQRCASVVIPGDHHRSCRPHRRDRALPLAKCPLVCAGRVAERLDASSPFGPVQVMLWKTVMQSGERTALGPLALAHDLRQPKSPELAAHGVEPAAGLDGGELAGVADRDHLRACLLGRLQHARAGPGARHPCLVEDENAFLWQLVAELLQIDQQPLERARPHPGLLGELTRGAARGRHAQHLEARALVDLTQHAGGVGLAGARQRLNDGNPVPRAHRRAHRHRLLSVQRPVSTCDRTLSERGINDAGPLPRAADRCGDQSPLAIHELSCRHLTPAGSDYLRTLGEPLGLAAHLANRGTLLRRGSELLQHVTLIEGVAALGQTPRARQAIAEALLVYCVSHRQAALDTLPARIDQVGQLVFAESQLAGTRPHLLAPGVGLHPVALALARGERRTLSRRLRPQANPALLRLPEHLVAALGEVFEQRPFDARELGCALVHPSPLQTETLRDKGAQVGLVEKAGGFRSAIERRAVQRRESTVAPA